MPPSRSLLLLTALLAGCVRPNPIVIAHRGASGVLPEHSLAAYAAAVGMQSDMIEPDVVASRDGVLICAHDLTLEQRTDVAQVYPDRGRSDGWYAVDFTAAELGRLTLTMDGQPQPGVGLATLDDMLALINTLDARMPKRELAVCPELKSPAFHLEQGIDTARELLAALQRHEFESDRVVIQCFEAATLRRLREELDAPYRLLYLTGEAIEQTRLRELATYVDGIGPSRKVLEQDPTLLPRCRALGLFVYAYTFNDEPEAVRAARRQGVDGVFSNYPDRTRDALAK